MPSVPGMVPTVGTNSLKSKVLRGGTWLLVANGAERGLRFIRIAVLARMLAPEDFGLMGLIAMALGYLDAITFTATNQAIIQHPSGRSREFLNTAFTIGAVRGLVLAVVVFLAASFAAKFFEQPSLIPMIRLTAITPIVMGLVNPAVQVILKDLNFRRWAVYRAISSTLSASVTVLLGLWLRNAWALVIGSIAEQISLVALSYVVSHYRPALTWDRSSARDLISFCRKAFAIPLIIGFLIQAPSVLLGKLTDMATLGAFLLTLALADLPTHVLTRIVATVGFPAYSSIAADLVRLRRSWLSTITWVVPTALLGASIVAISGSHLLTLAYGARYAAQAPVLGILCVSVVMRMVFMTTGPLMWAVGRPNVNRNAYLAGLVVTYVGGLVLVKAFGSLGMAMALSAGWTMATAVEILLCLRYFARRQLALRQTKQRPMVAHSGYPLVDERNCWSVAPLGTIKGKLSLRTRIYWRLRWANGTYVSKVPAIIIGGCYRSGTTLMRAMLDSHQNIAMGPESWLFVYRPDYHTLAKAYAFSLDEVDALRHRSTCLAHFIDLFFQEYARRMGKARWGEKSPPNVTRLSYIWRHFPNARFVHMIRDGRDVVCSIHSQHKRLRAQGINVPITRSLDQHINMWKSHVTAGIRWRGDPRYFELKYEDLVNSPHNSMRAVLDFLGEPWSDGVLKAHEIQRNHPYIADEVGTPEVRQPIFKTSVGRWRSELSERDAQRFWHRAGELLQSLGYRLNDCAGICGAP